MNAKKISHALRCRTTQQCNLIRKYDQSQFVKEWRAAKQENIRRNNLKSDPMDTRFYHQYPSFGIFQTSLDEKCAACEDSWHPNVKKSLGTFDDDKVANVQRLDAKTIYESIDKCDNNDETFYWTLSDDDWNDQLFQQFYEINQKKDPQLKLSIRLFNYFMDNYTHATSVNSSSFSMWLQNTAKAKVCYIYFVHYIYIFNLLLINIYT